MRTVILLGTPFFVSELRSLLATSSSVEVKYYDGASTVDGALYVYFGESKKDKARKYENISLTKLAKEARIVPILKNLDDFRSNIPDELSAINAISVDSVLAVGKLKCFILEFFGLLESNRKVFISYKRNDSLTFAHQLHDALVAAHYKPFLDSYSINYGVDFQEYLRHELSDSSVFVFLNTPNYPMSQFTMEELTVCSKLQMGILEIKTPNSSSYEEAKFSVRYELSKEITKDEKVDEAIISSIISTLENNRLEMQSFRQKALGDQLKSIYPDVIEDSDINGYESPSRKCMFFPVYHIPLSLDMQNIQSYSVKGLQVAGFYNGLYCRSDVRNHIEWLNGISPVQMLDITK